MARLSKTSPFQIYSDKGDQAADPSTHATDDGVKDEDELDRHFIWPGTRRDDGFVTESSDDEVKGGQYEGTPRGDDEKNYTRTSISSMPESNYPTDHERTPMYKPYTPTYSRPSVRRLQMSSPLRKGKAGTPHSEPRGSPRMKRRGGEFDDERESKQLPLVLLHITALPLNIPWSTRLMRETLPQHIFDNMQLLKSKMSETVLKRGILIPHPGDDYELLEEKLLEALELQEPRISKCGHFRASSTMTAGSDSADSGIGSSVDGSDEDHCTTCHHHLRAAGTGTRKWSVKVFAANGLMHASAWSAAWSEMERVDCEIMPWMKDELMIKLDERKADEFALQHIDHDADERRVSQLVEERLRLLEHDAERAREAEMAREIEQIVMNEQRQHSNTTHEFAMAYIEPAKPAESMPSCESASTELPDIYRPKDIPLSILLRNYIFLLVRKRWNTILLILVAAIGGLLSLLGPAAISGEGGFWTLDGTISAWTKPSQNAPAVPELGMPEPNVSAVSQSDVLDTIGVDSESAFDAAEPQDLEIVIVKDSPLVADEIGVDSESTSDAAEPQDLDNVIVTDSPLVVDDTGVDSESAFDAAEPRDSENVIVTGSPLVADDNGSDEIDEQSVEQEDVSVLQGFAETTSAESLKSSEPVTATKSEVLEAESQDKCWPVSTFSPELIQCMAGGGVALSWSLQRETATDASCKTHNYPPCCACRPAHAKALQNPSSAFRTSQLRGQADCTSDPSTNDYGTATTAKMSLVSGEKSNFQFILRLLNTNVDGKQKVMFALTQIKGVGRRYSNLVCKKADVDLNKRAGELTSEELERIVTIIQNPTQYKIPTWFLNRQRDIVDGKDNQVLANGVDSKLRDDLERLKKIRAHRGLRHYWGLRVRGQHSKTTGRRGRTVGVSKKKG
ncbi:hypothetical protein Q7P37_010700 [Cladosporium fusiforme]